MSKSPEKYELDAVLHQPVRTRIVAFLTARGESTFAELKTALDITDGNLDAHMKKLIAVDYIESRKESEHGRPQTFYRLTTQGQAAFKNYVMVLNKLLDM